MGKFFTRYIKYGLGVLLIPVFITQAFSQILLDPRTQPQFVNPLPVPSVIDGRNGGSFTIGISQFEQWLGLVNPGTQQPMQTKVWGYNGSYPGPTILAKKNVPIDIFWRNNLVNASSQPLPHLMPVDPSIHWAMEGVPNPEQYGIPVVTHLHGGHTESASDGLPNAWYTPGYSLKGSGFIKGDVMPYHYSNDQEAATLWYHDHALGITRLNVYAGLAGYYLLTDDNEMALQSTGKLPAAPYDIGLAIQDRMFMTDGQLFFPSMPPMPGQPGISVLPEFFGDFILVNGMTWPVLEVEPRQYRFRVLNGSDSRFFNVFLSNNLAIQQIATDNGLLAAPVTLPDLLIGPGERKDIILDFSHPSFWGQTIILRNNAKTPFPRGMSVDPQTTGRVMAFKVNKPLNTSYPLTSLPATLRSPIIPLQTSLPARKLVLFEAEDEHARLKPMLGTVEDGVMDFHDPITENPMLNSTEIWEIYNASEDAHPIHLHMVTMQLISRQKFRAEVDEEDGKISEIRLTGHPKTPAADEQGWKDTWVMYPGEVTRVIAKFDLEGLYVWHCHILSHEEHEMMRPYYVGEMNIANRMNTVAKNARPELEKQLQLQALPNPFSNYFTVRFNLTQSSTVSINLYDGKGSLVKNIYSGKLSSGLQQMKVDGTNRPNGVYYCEVVINGKRMLRKMILQK